MKKRIEGFEEHYKIDENGNVYSLDRYIGKKFFAGKKIKWSITNTGYARVQLSNGTGFRKKYSVHRLVAKHFICEPTEERNIVNHKDGNKLNNHYSNLEWCTAQENIIHSINAKLKRVKFSDDEIRFIRSWEGTNKELCKLIGINQDEVCHIKSRKFYSRVKD